VRRESPTTLTRHPRVAKPQVRARRTPIPRKAGPRRRRRLLGVRAEGKVTERIVPIRGVVQIRDDHGSLANGNTNAGVVVDGFEPVPPQQCRFMSEHQIGHVLVREGVLAQNAEHRPAAGLAAPRVL
jgi:hypothetical protein